MLGAKVDMELLAEFTASRAPNYKHGTPDGVHSSRSHNYKHGTPEGGSAFKCPTLVISPTALVGFMSFKESFQTARAIVESGNAELQKL